MQWIYQFYGSLNSKDSDDNSEKRRVKELLHNHARVIHLSTSLITQNHFDSQIVTTVVLEEQ